MLRKKFFFFKFFSIIFKIFANKLLPIHEFANRIPLGQKANPGRKKKITNALLFQTGDPELPNAEDVDTEYDLDAEFLDPTVPIIQTEVTKRAAHIYGNCDRVEENLFNQYSYDNKLSLNES